MSIPITLIVVDDHPLFRKGVVDALSLEADMRVAAQSSDGDEALRLIRSLRPTVAILDINLPGMNGQQITRQITQERLPTRVVLVTGYDALDQAIHAAMAGAAAYCAKDVEPKKLVSIVRHVADGKFVFGDRAMTDAERKRWVDEQIERARRSYSDPGSPFHPLSNREMEVLEYMVQGLSNKQIATLMNISHQTVKNHVTSILRKFCVEDRTEAVVYALQHGWVPLKSAGRRE